MENKKKIAFIVIIAIIILVALLIFFATRNTKTVLTVSFDTNGGEPVSSQEVEKGKKAEKPEEPKKEGYIFAGWYYEDKLFDFETPITQNITLEARWGVPGSANGDEFKLNTAELTLVPNETITLKVETTLENLQLKWSSSDESVAKVDQNGKVTALKEGTAIITVTAGEYEESCKVTIKKNKVAVTGVKISGANSVTVGSTIKLIATVSPSKASNKQVIWSSSNTNVATVDRNGNVKGIKAGTTIITVTTLDGKKVDRYKITVKPASKPSEPQKPTEPEKTKNIAVTGVVISGASSVNVNSNITLTAKVTPNNATNKKVTWSSSDSSIAKVDQNGKVTALKEGTVVITATTADGNKVAKHTITVKSVYAITLTSIATETGVFQYEIKVTKNGQIFTDYTGVNYNGRTAPFKQYVAKNYVNTSVTTAEIILKTGRVTAIVSYK